MGMRLVLPAKTYFYGNREKGKHKIGERMSLKRRVRLGCVQKVRTHKPNGMCLEVEGIYSTPT